MYSCECISQNKSVMKRKHPGIWGSVLALPLVSGDHQGIICWLFLLAAVHCRAEPARHSDFAQSLKSSAAPQKSALAWARKKQTWEIPQLGGPGYGTSLCWAHDEHTQKCCPLLCTGERATAVIKFTAEWGCQHKRWEVLLANLIQEAECVLKLFYPTSQILLASGWNVLSEEHGGTCFLCVPAAHSCAKASASPALRLGLFTKNQRREGRRKCVWFLESSQHLLETRPLEAMAAACIFSN